MRAEAGTPGTDPPARRRSPLAWVLLSVVAFYRRYVSRLLPPSCRYYPTCSTYAVQAIEIHGAVRGSAMAGKRILSCHPWSPGGFDPVPGSQAQSQPGAGHPDRGNDRGGGLDGHPEEDA